MTQLGSIFEPEAPGPRGRDLHADVTVPAWALGLPFAYEVRVPLDLAAEGGYARRTVSSLDTDDRVRLSLPAGFPTGGVVRLRGQGEALAGGRPGDLLVHVEVDRRRTEPPPEVKLALAAMPAPAPPAETDAAAVTYRLPVHGPPPLDANTLTWMAALLALVVAALMFG
ncbi:hypothetical protein SAMN02745121_01551 [Nannocystis exedens]|uniref:Chaperone DnaJ C-terminal domain-containing protein n=1 Tax=Nannocystis exedens TaxID=54 RepID=A0A1I1V543_9BACT|nr:DnaJ C-terminal domain-containing protein [Nannocystis exedens]PCC72348.1 hypothetical protein NAEX_05428 [Nannocystis exedens]SFD78024.1 hypothetical protein SAMN02745121_01551 [Nannocystis exedens]